MKQIQKSHCIYLVSILVGFTSATLSAFCGFYVAKADTDLFNNASKVVLVRDGDKTVLTMANDYEGEAKDFAMVIPVPTKIERGQIHVGNNAAIDRIDAFTAPRLVEYFDRDPCEPPMMMEAMADGAMMRRGAAKSIASSKKQSAKSLGVTIEAEYTVGEYDIAILSAKQSGGLFTYLNQEGYKVPAGAERVLGSYIKQKMRFFIAKVNLKEKAKLGNSYLRPLQVAYEHPRFMLPIRLGTLNAKGSQDLFVFTITKQGRVETTNYPTVKIASGDEIPVYVKDEFKPFYKDMFSTAVKRDGMKSVFLEYAWDLGWCDPCAADPLNAKELKELGVFWQTSASNGRRLGRMPGVAQSAYVTRLHLRYDAEHFPEDLMFQETKNRQNFQGRYVLRHPFKGATCELAENYYRNLETSQEKRAQNLANLTGWDINTIRSKMYRPSKDRKLDATPFWNRLWGDDDKDSGRVPVQRPQTQVAPKPVPPRPEPEPRPIKAERPWWKFWGS